MNLDTSESGKKSSEDVKVVKEDADDLNKNILPKEREEIIDFLQKIKFPRKIFGGVDEVVVWKKISELDTLYAKALEAERIRYDALLSRYHSVANQYIKQIKEERETKGSGSDVEEKEARDHSESDICTS